MRATWTCQSESVTPVLPYLTPNFLVAEDWAGPGARKWVSHSSALDKAEQPSLVPRIHALYEGVWNNDHSELPLPGAESNSSF